MRFDHIGIITAGLEAGRTLLENAVGVRAWTEPFEDGVNDVWVQFGHDASGICYELVAPLSDRSPIRRILAQKINTLNHIACLVNDLTAEAERLVAAGFLEVAQARPAIAYGNRPIQFFVSRSRLLIELIEAPDHQHRFRRTA
jgi:methylmalonyl-CoA/ethylmalonyl-CoA epimerase